MPCKSRWETADGRLMPMHYMTDRHVLNAYKKLEEIIEDGESDGNDEFDSYEFTESMVNLELEAERRWGPG